MKKWLKIIMVSFFLFTIVPLTADAAENNLTVKDKDVTVSVDIPAGKSGVITSLRMQLRVSVNSGTMNAPVFKFDSAVKSEIKDAVIMPGEKGTYVVDLILSGQKDKSIFGGSESAKIGTLSVRPTSQKYKIKVETLGELDNNESPVVKYMDANGVSAMTETLGNSKPVLIETSGAAFGKVPLLKASVKNGSRSVSFSWNKVEGADGYVLYEVKSGKNTRVTTLSASATSLAKNYAYATDHSFKLRAFKKDADGSITYGDYSPVVNITVGPNQVKAFSPEYKNSSKVTLTWREVSKASGYQIYRSAKKNGTYKLVKDIKKGGTTSCTLKHPSGKTYYYKVKAYISKSGNTVTGSFSKTESAKTKAPKLKVSRSSASVSLKWKKVSRAAGYKVYRSKTKSGKYKLVKTINKASGLTFTESMPKGSKVWYYKVCAFEKPKKGKSLSGNYSSAVKVKAK
ncbi:MAG: hypothetical protein HFI69_03230 [Lachnospiraceae bacterium]|nr:hypothetical protein [Lachnospiraceae bacterium]